MSFATAAAEVQSQLVAAGLTEFADPRVDTLTTAGGGDLDGKYLLKFDSLGNPWQEVGTSETAWYAECRLEVATLLHNDEVTEAITAETRARACVDNLQRTSLTNGCVINAQDKQFQRAGKDRRLIWTWRFWLRYTE